jgi:hypothetical protein
MVKLVGSEETSVTTNGKSQQLGLPHGWHMRGSVSAHLAASSASPPIPAHNVQLAWKIHEELAGADQAVEIV